MRMVTCPESEERRRSLVTLRRAKCILVKKQWFTPTEFEKFAGKESTKNWKVSIRCCGTILGKLIKMEDQTEQQPGTSQDSRKVLKVTCGSAAGTLHIRRFASGTCGKSIRTETSWLTPMEFTQEASCQTDVSWRKDIQCEGEPLSALIEAKILRIHSLIVVNCMSWQENQKNDDECCICKSGGEEEEYLVVCDHCPRSFHPRCHLPQIDDRSVGRKQCPCSPILSHLKQHNQYFYVDNQSVTKTTLKSNGHFITVEGSVCLCDPGSSVVRETRLKAIQKTSMKAQKGEAATSPGLGIPGPLPGARSVGEARQSASGGRALGPRGARSGTARRSNTGPPPSSPTTCRAGNRGRVLCPLGSRQERASRCTAPWWRGLALGTWSITSLARISAGCPGALQT
uniref:SAND domain-containing protein n=1 Tax=Amphiprion ocellaris TaxID=80972 RepID=A0AAQ6A3X2_AMPOC